MIKLSQIVNSQEALQKLLQLPLPVKIAYKLSKLINKLDPELRIYEEQRIKLVKELGEQTDKEKDMWSVKKENIVKFREELLKLTEIEVNLSFGPDKESEKIKIEDLGDIKVEAQDLIHLDWLFE